MKHPTVYDLLLKGLPPKEVAALAKVSPQTVYSTRINHSMPTARKMRDAAITQRFNDGWSDDQIADDLLVTPQTVKRARTRLGLRRRPNFEQLLKDVDWTKTNLTIVKETGAPYSSVVYWRSVYETHR